MSERSEVKRDGAKAQKNSGRGDYQKGDAKWKKFVVLRCVQPLTTKDLPFYKTLLRFYKMKIITTKFI